MSPAPRTCAAILFACSPALAQAPSSNLTPVDQGLADLHSLAASLRTDLAVHPPTDHLVNVYTDPAHPDQFVRVDGAMKVVFPNSVYAQTRYGQVPLVPAGTVFHFDESGAQAMPGVLVDMRVPDGTTARANPRALKPIRFVNAVPEPSTRDSGDARDPEPVALTEATLPERTRRAAMVTMSDELYRRTKLREIAAR